VEENGSSSYFPRENFVMENPVVYFPLPAFDPII